MNFEFFLRKIKIKMYQIPLPLAELELENPPDDTGLTMSEKRSIRNVWNMISPDIEKHACEQSVRCHFYFFKSNNL